MKYAAYILIGFIVLVISTNHMPEYNFQYDQKGVCKTGTTPQLVNEYIVCK